MEWWEEASFHLRWIQHGGSGLGRTYQELLDMPIDHLIRDVKRVNERRRTEARAIQQAHENARGRR